MTRLAILAAVLALAACAAPQPTLEAEPLVTILRHQYALGACPQGQHAAVYDRRPAVDMIEIVCEEGRRHD